MDQTLTDGERLELAGGVRVVSTPGHTAGHQCLYLERSRTLIAGDALLSHRGRLHGPSPDFTMDLPTAHESVRKLAEFDVRAIVLAYRESGRDVREELRAALAELPGEGAGAVRGGQPAGGGQRTVAAAAKSLEPSDRRCVGIGDLAGEGAGSWSGVAGSGRAVERERCATADARSGAGAAEARSLGGGGGVGWGPAPSLEARPKRWPSGGAE